MAAWQHALSFVYDRHWHNARLFLAVGILPVFFSDTLDDCIGGACVCILSLSVWYALIRANENLHFALYSKNETVSFAVHEIRNPLAVLSGYAQVIHEKSRTINRGREHEAAGIIVEASKQIAFVVEEYLVASSFGKNSTESRGTVFQFDDLACSVALANKEIARKKGISLRYAKNTRTRLLVSGEQEKLRQALSCVVDNAIKYTPRGCVSVFVEQKGCSSVQCIVKDSGIGIRSEEKHAVFQKWKRGQNAKSTAQGSGLGLYLAKEIIEAHGGTISVREANVGRGSVFSIVLPRASLKG